MIRFIAKDALEAIGTLQNAAELVARIKDKNPSEIICKAHCESLLEMLKPVEKVSDKLNLNDSKTRVKRLQEWLEYMSRTASEVHADLHGLFHSFWEELNGIHFAFIPADKVKYFEQAQLFGESVFDKFASAREDIKAAGNCRAVDLHAATVYHLMCAVNIGLIALAYHLRVKI